LLAPDLLLPETGSVFIKKVRAGDMIEAIARRGLEDIPRLVQLIPSGRSLLDRAMDIALAHQRSFYDSLYVALALERNCPFITADERLDNALKLVFPQTVLWIEDVQA
jgi:predicted nucleic acid-binding protein